MRALIAARRISAVAALGVLALAARGPAAGRQAVWPGDRWATAAPERHGFDAAALATLDRDARAGVYGLIDRLFVTHGGVAIVDHTYVQDYRQVSRGRVSAIGCGEGCTDPAAMHEFNYYHPDWHPYYQGRPIHSLQSVTKSIAATAIGIALGEGRLSLLDVPFLDFFEDRDLSRVAARVKTATVEDLLTMRSGIEWHEGDRPLDDTNTTVQLEKSRDWIQFTLEQPADADPGTTWTYNSGGSMLLSGVVRTATGRFVDDYAAEKLFRPIGIVDFHWKRTPTGHPDTEGGLYLAAEDLARIGYLYLRDGRWRERRVLPEGWVRRATSRHVRNVGSGWDYGYQWWLTSRHGVDVWAGRGFGGQLLIVVPARDVVAVVNAWNVFGGGARNIFGPLVEILTADRSGAGRRP